jgi:hypothetical protein
MTKPKKAPIVRPDQSDLPRRTRARSRKQLDEEIAPDSTIQHTHEQPNASDSESNTSDDEKASLPPEKVEAIGRRGQTPADAVAVPSRRSAKGSGAGTGAGTADTSVTEFGSSRMAPIRGVTRGATQEVFLSENGNEE